MPSKSQNILRGAGSVLEICPRPKKTELAKTWKAHKSINEALAEDWKKIGNDLWCGIAKCLITKDKELKTKANKITNVQLDQHVKGITIYKKALLPIKTGKYKIINLDQADNKKFKILICGGRTIIFTVSEHEEK